MPWFAVETHLFVEARNPEQAAELGGEIAISAAHANREGAKVIMAAFDARVPNDAEQQFIDASLAEHERIEAQQRAGREALYGKIGRRR